MKTDLLLKNAVTRRAAPVDVAIQSGRLVALGPDLVVEAAQTVDARGGLVTESFVNGHLHLDKVWTLEKVGQDALASYTSGTMGGAMTSIEQASRVKDQYDASWILPNVRRALDLAVRYGTSHVRAFADVDTRARLEGVKALLTAREEYRDRITVQVVAFPQDGVARDPGAEDWVRRALELGADAVGGIPWIEYTDADALDHVRRMVALAVEFDRDVSMLVDDAGDPGLRTTELLALETIRRGRQGRVTVQHARAMQLYPEPYYRKLEHLLLEAGIGVISDPHTGPLAARVKDLHRAGVPVGLGQDDIADAYYPFGRNNPLEVAFLAAHLLEMRSQTDLELLYDWITTQAARALGVADFALERGKEANLVVHRFSTVAEVLTYHEAPVVVVKAGRVVSP